MSFNIYCSAQLNENVTTFCFTVYVAFLHVVNEQKVCLLPEAVKPSTAVYDTVTGQLADTPTRGLPTRGLDDSRTGHFAVSYTHLTLPTIYSV